MRRIGWTVAVLLTCWRPAAAATAHVRVLHAAPGLAAVNVYLDGDELATQVAYQAFSEYQPVRAGTHNFKAVLDGTDSFLDDRDANLEEAQCYTIALVPRGDGVGFLRIRDPATPPSERRVTLGTVHLSADAPAVAVGPPGDPPLATLAYGQAMRAVEWRAEPLTLVYRKPDGDALISLEKQPLEAGFNYILFLVGKPGGEEAEALAILVDKQTPPTSPDEAVPLGHEVTPTPTGEQLPRLRIVNASPGSGALCGTLDDRPLLRGLEYGQATEYLPVTLGTHILAVGEGEDRAELACDLSLPDPYTILVIDPAPRVSLWLLRDYEASEQPTEASVRILNAADGVGPVDVRLGGEGTSLAEGLGSAGTSRYQSVPVGAPVRLTFTPAAASTILRSIEVGFDAATAYTVILMGKAKPGEGEPALSLRVLKDG